MNRRVNRNLELLCCLQSVLWFNVSRNVNLKGVYTIDGAVISSTALDRYKSVMNKDISHPPNRRSAQFASYLKSCNRYGKFIWPTAAICRKHQCIPQHDGIRRNVLGFEPVVEKFYFREIIHSLHREGIITGQSFDFCVNKIRVVLWALPVIFLTNNRYSVVLFFCFFDESVEQSFQKVCGLRFSAQDLLPDFIGIWKRDVQCFFGESHQDGK